ncbi:hypothetical protein, partial [Porphyromonas sp.]|uniref:hypothetical protein n=1 Tax=Porphyromonas sp. TaxID=1924944 RepID=UPI0025F15C5B
FRNEKKLRFLLACELKKRLYVRGIAKAEYSLALFVSCCIRYIYEFQKEFPSWNFLVPREELSSSKGGTF